MTKQETFDIVAKHLLTQNAKSVHSHCLYRSPEGLKCAAGCLIPDDLYVPELERCGTVTINYAPTPPGEIIMGLGHDLKLVRRLQDVHDQGYVADWPLLLSRVANDFELNTDALV